MLVLSEQKSKNEITHFYNNLRTDFTLNDPHFLQIK